MQYVWNSTAALICGSYTELCNMQYVWNSTVALICGCYTELWVGSLQVPELFCQKLGGQRLLGQISITSKKSFGWYP